MMGSPSMSPSVTAMNTFSREPRLERLAFELVGVHAVKKLAAGCKEAVAWHRVDQRGRLAHGFASGLWAGKQLATCS